MTDADLLELIRAGERPGVEFKNPRARQDRSFPQVVKAVLAMANRRDGGIILIGVNDDGEALGLSPEQLQSWQPDHVRQAVAPYADPYVYLDVETVAVTAAPLANRSFAVIKVSEFDQVPVLCSKAANNSDGSPALQLGACYIRTNHMPATSQVAEHSQFREILDLATEKSVRTFLKRAAAVGLSGGAPPTDDERFAAQRARLDE